MRTLKNSLIQNINISLKIQPFSQIYLINHQNCAVIRTYLACSGYPAFGQNNPLEIKINANLLTFANTYVLRKFPTLSCILALIDINGTVASLNITTRIWTVIYLGTGTNTQGLWWGIALNGTYQTVY